MVAFKLDWSPKRLHGHVDFNESQMYWSHTFLQLSNNVIPKFEKIQFETDRAEDVFLSNAPIIYCNFKKQKHSFDRISV